MTAVALTPTAEAELILRVHNAPREWSPVRLSDIERALYLCRTSQAVMGPRVAAQMVECQGDILARLHGPDWAESPEALALGLARPADAPQGVTVTP